MLLHPLICGHTKGNFISEGLNGIWKQTISSECSSPLVSIKSSTSGGQAHTTPTTVWTAILSSNITCYLPLSFYVLQYLFFVWAPFLSDPGLINVSNLLQTKLKFAQDMTKLFVNVVTRIYSAVERNWLCLLKIPIRNVSVWLGH